MYNDFKTETHQTRQTDKTNRQETLETHIETQVKLLRDWHIYRLRRHHSNSDNSSLN